MHFARHCFTRLADPYWNGLVVIAGVLLAAAAHETKGATISARSPALADVQTAISLAKDGDIVAVPAGSAHWTALLTMSKSVTLQGATTISNAGTQNASANDLTTIIDDNTSGKAGLINVVGTPAQNIRITGFTFKKGLGGSGPGMVHLTTGNTSSPLLNMRVDHCHFVSFTGRAVQTDGWVYGVADHNYMQAQNNGQAFFINCASYGGKTMGHGAWADYPWFGTNKFFFIEDNTMVGNGIVSTSGTIDCEHGGRWVARHNYFINCRPAGHGTEGGYRGTRAVEVYDNKFNWSIPYSAMNRSGVYLYHDNEWVGSGQSDQGAHSHVALFREFGAVGVSSTYGMADGTSPWDANDTEGNGTYVAGHAPHVFDSGTVKSGSRSGGTATLTDTSKSWTTNQWVGYSVTQTNPSSPCYPKGSYIISNTANTLTYCYYGETDRGPNLLFASGDTYKMHRVLIMMDQVGRGKGDLLSGVDNSTTNTVTGSRLWPHQALEPAMSWNNVYTPTNTAYGFKTNAPTEIQGRDYYNLGKGLPVDSTPSPVSTTYTASLNGVAYTGTYTYPHPLTGPAPPSNLTIVTAP